MRKDVESHKPKVQAGGKLQMSSVIVFLEEIGQPTLGDLSIVCNDPKSFSHL